MKKKVIRILLSMVLFVFSIFFKMDNLFIYLIIYVVIGYDILIKCIQNILKKNIIDENFLMTIATLGAFTIGEYQEAIAVMLFYQIGEFLGDYAVDKSKKSIESLMNIKPDYANLYKDFKIIRVDPNDVKIGDIIIINPGEKVPIDGVILEGDCMLDMLALTGESIPKHVKKGDLIFSGCINQNGNLKLKVTKEFQESTVYKILELVQNASNRKSKSEKFISKFASYYTKIVVFLALLLAIFLPIVTNLSFQDGLYRALSFLVVSCPCALVISIPLSFFSGIGASSRIGVLIKGSNYLETLSKSKIIVCDKTGTLTEGVFQVNKIESVHSNEQLLKYAVYAECFSNHPIAISLKESYQGKIDQSSVGEVKEIAGMGISAKVENQDVLVGNDKLMKKYHIKFKKNNGIGTILYIAINNQFEGTILISDVIKKDSYQAIKDFKKNNLKVIMLTGDRKDISHEIAKKLFIEKYYAELLPQDKVRIVEDLMNEKDKEEKLIFVGDGINDAPVLALADLGVSMGGIGSDAAIEASDMVIMTDQISKILEAIKISKKTMKIVKQNIVFSISIKVGILIFSALGFTTMWGAVFADVGVSFLAIINSLRIFINRRSL